MFVICYQVSLRYRTNVFCRYITLIIKFLHFDFSHRITHIEYFCWSYVPYNKINHLFQKNIVPFEGPKIQFCFIFNFNLPEIFVDYCLTSPSNAACC